MPIMSDPTVAVKKIQWPHINLKHNTEIEVEDRNYVDLINSYYATVYRGWIPVGDGQAIEVRLKEYYSPEDGDVKGSEEMKDGLARRLIEWRRASESHPNITPVLGFTERICPTAKDFFLLPVITPYYRCGNIRVYLEEKGRHLDEVLRLLLQVADALVFLHTQDPPLIHQSIKGENILINTKGEAKLTEVGLSEFAERAQCRYISRGPEWRSRWMAPELISSDPVSGKYSTKSDVYSFGMTMLEVLTGQAPYSNLRKAASVLRALVMDKEIPPRPDCSLITDELWDLMKDCWKYEPSERPSIQQVLTRLQGITSTLTRTRC